MKIKKKIGGGVAGRGGGVGSGGGGWGDQGGCERIIEVFGKIHDRARIRTYDLRVRNPLGLPLLYSNYKI